MVFRYDNIGFKLDAREKVQGIWKLNQTKSKNGVYDESNEEIKLVDFNGKGKYSKPEFVWDKPVGPTAVKFLDSAILGDNYENNMFVGDVNNGRIYHFELTQDRKDILLPVELSSRVIEEPSSRGVNKIVFGEGFGGITDLEVGPDGNLYVVSIGLGGIYQISPAL